MSKFKVVCILIFITLFSAGILAAKTEVPPWMENVDKTGRSTYLVPKGAKRKVIGSQIIVEPPNEYVARRLYEMEADLEKRFSAIEEHQKKIQNELEEINGIIKARKEGVSLSQDVEGLKNAVKVLEEFKRITEEAVLPEEPEVKPLPDGVIEIKTPEDENDRPKGPVVIE